jgi:hypothetical protein
MVEADSIQQSDLHLSETQKTAAMHADHIIVAHYTRTFWHGAR